MPIDVSKIIPVTTSISPTGVGFANFAKAVMFAPETELPAGFAVDTTRDYNSLTTLSVDFASTTDTYKAMERWLGGIPTTTNVTVYGAATADADWTTTLNKARNLMWWFWSFFTAPVYASVPDATVIAAWSEANETLFPNNQTGAAATTIRDPADGGIAKAFTTLGHRNTFTFTHATDPYSGNSLAKWFAAVNYSAAGSTITGEYKKLSGVGAESLTATETNAMSLDTVKSAFYSVVDLQGSVDNGRVINSYTHSAFGEFIDDVINLHAFVNAVKVAVYNAIANQTKKLGQEPVGQAVLITAARTICEQYVRNNYLGAQNYINPDDGLITYTVGYEILTKPEDILNLLAADRAARKASPLRIRIFRKGAIHIAPVDISVY
jgi:hypothetical protein